jgi:hypothetical protein
MIQDDSHAAAHGVATTQIPVYAAELLAFPDLDADSRMPTLGAGIGDSATVSETSMLDAAVTAFSAAQQQIPVSTSSIPNGGPFPLKLCRPNRYSNPMGGTDTL